MPLPPGTCRHGAFPGFYCQWCSEDRAREHYVIANGQRYDVPKTYLPCCGGGGGRHEPGCTRSVPAVEVRGPITVHSVTITDSEHAEPGTSVRQVTALELLAEFLDDGALVLQDGKPSRIEFMGAEIWSESSLTEQEEARLCRIFALRAQELGL